MKKLFFIISIFFLIIFIYSFRGIYLQEFDYSYSKDLYDHSQWTLAKTVRSVSDDQEYQVAGYDAVRYGELYRITPEVPPLGKYLIGLSIIFFNNAQAMSLILYFISIIIFYYLASLLLRDSPLTKMSTLIFMTEPLLFSQATLSMMDLPLLITIMIHAIFIIKLLKNKKKYNFFTEDLPLIIGAGLSLGAFLAIKIGFFALIIIAIDTYILLKNKKSCYFIYILFCSFLFYLVLYFPYFMKGNNFIEFLKAQKWMIAWYLSSKVKPLIGMSFLSLGLGVYKNWSDGSQFNRFIEWTVLWPVYLWVIFISLRDFIKNRSRINIDHLYIFLLCFGFFCLFIIIPFWVRYLVIILPFLIIYFVGLIPRINKKILILILLIYSIQVSIYLYQPLSQNFLNQLDQSWEKGIYQDIYNSVDSTTKKYFSRQQFWRSNQRFDYDLGIIHKTVVIKKINKFWQYPQTVDIEINYQTPISDFADKYRTQFIKENGQWKIKWNYNPGSAKSKYINGNYGKLISKDGIIISEGLKRPYYSVTLAKIKNETLLQQQLLYLTGLKKYDLEFKYKANNQSDWPSDIGFLKSNLSIASAEALILDPGINVDIKETRVFNTNIFKDSKKIQIIEKKQNLLLPIINPKIGGMIEIIQNNKTKYAFSKNPENGKDYILKDF